MRPMVPFLAVVLVLAPAVPATGQAAGEDPNVIRVIDDREGMFAHDPDPARTLAVQAEILNLLDDLRRHGVPDDEVTLTREEVLGRSSGAGAEAGLVWEDVLGMASRNARPIARYLAFMVVAGVVGSYGVIDYNVILIVGAMVVGPEFGPIAGLAPTSFRSRRSVSDWSTAGSPSPRGRS